MPISVQDNCLTEKAMEYAKLSDFAYAKWKQIDGQWQLDSSQANYLHYAALRKEIETNYIIRYIRDDKSTGYQGIIFQSNSDGKWILANRGADEAIDFLVVAKSIIDNRIMPAEQFRSMVEFINYTIGSDHFEVTGHSLGGCLAEIAKAAYADKVDEVYTYSALGALTLNKTYEYLRPSETSEKVIVWDKVTEHEWDRTAWEKYEAFFINQQSAGSSKIYNIAGSSDILASGGGPDIGSEMFVDGMHGIEEVIKNIKTSPFYIDPRKPVTVIGSSRNEIFYGNYNSKHYSGNYPASVTLVGGYGNDELWGDIGNDSLYGDLPPELNTNKAKELTGNLSGEPGRDRLIGGKGNDFLYGGNGYDTYIYYDGDGNDIIEDDDNKGKIVVDLQAIDLGAISTGNFYKAGTGNVWRDPNGKITLTQGTSWTITLQDSSTITLSGSHGIGDFGIQLLNIPDLPTNGQTILGTSAADIISSDSAGDDLIDGLAGDDNIYAWKGGDDWLVGGEGSDILNSYRAVGSNDVLEGGSGADLLAGGPGDDLLFGEVYGEMADLIAAGEITPNEAGKGDLISGGFGNDYIYGSNRGDALMGFDGHDLIVGGGGDDAIFGDDDYGLATRDWSFTITQGVSVTLNGLTLETGTALGDDAIYAGMGNDFVYAGGGGDEVYGGEGNDTILGEAGDDFISGDGGDDFLEGDASWVAVADHGNDYIDGGAGNDQIWGQGGSDELFAKRWGQVLYFNIMNDMRCSWLDLYA